MIRLIRQWKVSRSLDRGPATPSGPDPLVAVDRALRASRPAIHDPTPGLHERTLDAVRRSSRPRRAPRPFLSLHLAMTAVLLVCGVIGVFAVLAPQAPRVPVRTATATPGPQPGREQDPAPPSNLLGGGLQLAGLWQEIAAPLKRVTEESIQEPARQEAEHIVADAKRAGEFVLVKIPFLSRDESKQ